MVGQECLCFCTNFGHHPDDEKSNHDVGNNNAFGSTNAYDTRL